MRRKAAALVIALTLLAPAAASAWGAKNVCPGYSKLSRAKRANVRAVVKVAKRHHVSKANTRAMLVLCKRESGYRRKAVNGNCKGLFQLLITRAHPKGLYYDGRWHWKNARKNTAKALAYMRGRYGSPSAALAHSYSCGWY